jgi:hypothetical protein
MTVSQGPVAVIENQLDAAYPTAVATGAKALAALQKPTMKQSRYLVVSPYSEQEHLLDLESLDIENQLLALSLTTMKCLRDDYATAPYIETFNWADMMATLRALARQINHSWKETSFFVVAFRSQIPPTTAYSDLAVLDKAAHSEATASGGFLK